MTLAEQDEVGRVKRRTAAADRPDVMNLETAFARSWACLTDAVACSHERRHLAPASRVDHLLVGLAVDTHTLTGSLTRSLAVDAGTTTRLRSESAASRA